MSLAKLSALACANPQDGEKELDEINAMADLVALQESLSVQILAKNGYTKANCPVLEPAEMIKIITEANSQREQDYKIGMMTICNFSCELAAVSCAYIANISRLLDWWPPFYRVV